MCECDDKIRLTVVGNEKEAGNPCANCDFKEQLKLSLLCTNSSNFTFIKKVATQHY